jgi:hypothetical protein
MQGYRILTVKMCEKTSQWSASLAAVWVHLLNGVQVGKSSQRMFFTRFCPDLPVFGTCQAHCNIVVLAISKRLLCGH